MDLHFALFSSILAIGITGAHPLYSQSAGDKPYFTARLNRNGLSRRQQAPALEGQNTSQPLVFDASLTVSL